MVLFLVVFVARLTIGRRKTEPVFVGLLLVSSIVFYMWHVPAYFLILLWSAGIDYLAALWLVRVPMAQHGTRRLIWSSARHESRPARRLQIRRLHAEVSGRVGRPAGMERPHAGLAPAAADGHQLLHLPVAVLHHRRLPRRDSAVRGFGQFLLFITFFPQLVAGPIVRASEFLPRCRARAACGWWCSTRASGC